MNKAEHFKNILKKASGKYSLYELWCDFILISGIMISNAIDKKHFDKRENLYFTIIKKYNKKELDIFAELFACVVLALEENPAQDFLGKLCMELNFGDNHNKQIFTPYTISKLMAQILVKPCLNMIQDKGFVSINDPTCGAGSTLLAAVDQIQNDSCFANLNWQNHILVTGQDISLTAWLMCYIQISLLGCAGYIKIGDTLTNPIINQDSDNDYWYTPMYFSDIWTLRRIFLKYDFFT